MPPVVLFAFTIKILDDQEITDNCRRAQIYNDIHIITRKYTDVYRENGRFDRRKLYTCPALPSIMRFIVEIIIFIGFRVVVRVGFRI